MLGLPSSSRFVRAIRSAYRAFRGPRLAVLIDADNIYAKYTHFLMTEVAKHGNPVVRRVYGDWAKPSLSYWREKSRGFGLFERQASASLAGKNSSDIGIMMDGTDLLYSGKYDGFVVVSSDSDFTGLVTRFREDGKLVIGIGESRALTSFRSACSKFIPIDSGQSINQCLSDAAEMQGFQFNAKPIRLSPANGTNGGGVSNKRRPQSTTADDPLNTTLSIGGTSQHVTEEMLRREFAAYGDVADVRIRVSTNKTRFAFVRFRERHAQRAMDEAAHVSLAALNPYKPVRLEWAIEQIAMRAREPENRPISTLAEPRTNFSESQISQVTNSSPKEVSETQALQRTKDEDSPEATPLSIILAAMRKQGPVDEWHLLGTISNMLLLMDPDFTPQKYGWTKLSNMVESIPDLEVKSDVKHSQPMVRYRGGAETSKENEFGCSSYYVTKFMNNTSK